jgi:hypothetical protein
MREATECIIYQLNYEDNSIPYLDFKNIYFMDSALLQNEHDYGEH